MSERAGVLQAARLFGEALRAELRAGNARGSRGPTESLTEAVRDCLTTEAVPLDKDDHPLGSVLTPDHSNPYGAIMYGQPYPPSREGGYALPPPAYAETLSFDFGRPKLLGVLMMHDVLPGASVPTIVAGTLPDPTFRHAKLYFVAAPHAANGVPVSLAAMEAERFCGKTSSSPFFCPEAQKRRFDDTRLVADVMAEACEAHSGEMPDCVRLSGRPYRGFDGTAVAELPQDGPAPRVRWSYLYHEGLAPLLRLRPAETSIENEACARLLEAALASDLFDGAAVFADAAPEHQAEAPCEAMRTYASDLACETDVRLGMQTVFTSRLVPSNLPLGERPTVEEARDFRWLSVDGLGSLFMTSVEGAHPPDQRHRLAQRYASPSVGVSVCADVALLALVYGASVGDLRRVTMRTLTDGRSPDEEDTVRLLVREEDMPSSATAFDPFLDEEMLSTEEVVTLVGDSDAFARGGEPGCAFPNRLVEDVVGVLRGIQAKGVSSASERAPEGTAGAGDATDRPTPARVDIGLDGDDTEEEEERDGTNKAPPCALAGLSLDEIPAFRGGLAGERGSLREYAADVWRFRAARVDLDPTDIESHGRVLCDLLAHDLLRTEPGFESRFLQKRPLWANGSSAFLGTRRSSLEAGIEAVRRLLPLLRGEAGDGFAAGLEAFLIVDVAPVASAGPPTDRPYCSPTSFVGGSVQNFLYVGPPDATGRGFRREGDYDRVLELDLDTAIRAHRRRNVYTLAANLTSGSSSGATIQWFPCNRPVSTPRDARLRANAANTLASMLETATEAARAPYAVARENPTLGETVVRMVDDYLTTALRPALENAVRGMSQTICDRAPMEEDRRTIATSRANSDVVDVADVVEASDSTISADEVHRLAALAQEREAKIEELKRRIRELENPTVRVQGGDVPARPVDVPTASTRESATRIRRTATTADEVLRFMENDVVWSERSSKRLRDV